MMMQRDYGSGLSIDDLIGLSAGRIKMLSLPNEALYQALQRTAGLLVDRGNGYFMLAELWGDGHSVWYGLDEDDVLQVTPTGQIIQASNRWH